MKMTSTGPPWVTVGHRLFQGSKSLEISHLHNPGLRQDRMLNSGKEQDVK